MKGVYLLHFEPRYKHAGHYLGFAQDILRRVHEHRTGVAGCKLTDAAARAGVTMMLVRVWKNKSRKFERGLKGFRRDKSGRSTCVGSLARICPACLELRLAMEKAGTE
jgi:predicted GIY-YIG superfamily endonuclease